VRRFWKEKADDLVEDFYDDVAASGLMNVSYAIEEELDLETDGEFDCDVSEEFESRELDYTSMLRAFVLSLSDKFGSDFEGD
jgi:hypothetical protein